MLHQSSVVGKTLVDAGTWVRSVSLLIPVLGINYRRVLVIF